MNKSLEFVIMVDIDLPHDRFLSLVKSLFPRIYRDRHREFEAEGHRIEVRNNEDYRPLHARDKEDSFLQMRYCVEVTPISPQATEDGEVAFATRIIHHIRAQGGTTTHLAAYEHRLEF